MSAKNYIVMTFCGFSGLVLVVAGILAVFVEKPAELWGGIACMVLGSLFLFAVFKAFQPQSRIGSKR